MPDRFDMLHLVGLLIVAGGLLLLILTPQPEAGAMHGGRLDRAMEKQMLARARIDFLEQTYAPVVELSSAADYAAALLKLKELERDYPGEPHGDILRGEILLAQQAWQPATASFVRGVKGNGDYVDAKSPLSRHDTISRLVDEGLQQVGAQAQQHPDNSSLQGTMRDLYYLQSRLAGGCE